jgi:hypothetical protein
MDYCNAINIIILALIIAIVFHLLFKAANANRYEAMENTTCPDGNCIRKSNMSYTPDENITLDQGMRDDNCNTDKPIKKVRFANLSENSSDSMNNDFASSYNDSISSVQNPRLSDSMARCGILKTEERVDDYIRAKLLDESAFCVPEKKYCDRVELDKYRDDFFGFRNHTSQNSNGVDAVDRVNDLYLSGNTDLSRNHKGVKIQDLFNSITQGSVDKPKENPIREIDLNTTSIEVNPMGITGGMKKKSGATNDYYSNDNWVYDSEKLENGGEFYNGIFASDPSNSNFAAL